VHPVRLRGYLRHADASWEERRKHKDTTAASPSAAIAMASEIVERLVAARPRSSDGRAVPTSSLITSIRARRPPRVKEWSIRHRDEETRYRNLYVLPVIADLPCRELTR
jgi:hypothetical protein